MICEGCGKTHRTQEAGGKCLTRVAKRAILLEKKEKEVQRRLDVEAKMDAKTYIREHFCSGDTSADKVSNQLNRDYPPPHGGGKWTFIHVISEHASHLNWGS